MINLSTKKERAISESLPGAEAWWEIRRLRRGLVGREGRDAAEAVSSVELWAGCVFGALEKAEHEAQLSAAGFVNVSVEITHTYPTDLVTGSLGPEDVEALRSVPIASAVISARKPAE